MIASPQFHTPLHAAKSARTRSIVLHTAGWTFGMLWPLAAIAVLAFMFSDPGVSAGRLTVAVISIAVGSALAAKVDCWLLSGEDIIQR